MTASDQGGGMTAREIVARAIHAGNRGAPYPWYHVDVEQCVLSRHLADAVLLALAKAGKAVVDVAEDESDDVQCCMCDAKTPREKITHYGDDADYCPACSAKLDAAFKACPHEWVSGGHDEMGDPVGHCEKCGFYRLSAATTGDDPEPSTVGGEK